MSRYVFFHKKQHTHTYTNPQPVANPTPSLVPRFSPFRGNLLAVGTGQWPNGWLERMGVSIRIFLKWSYKNSTPKKWLKINEKLHWGYFTLVVGAQNSEGPYHVQHGIMENEASECFFSNRDKLGRTANPPKQDVYKLHPRNGWP